MKRSEVNAILRDAMAFLDEMKFRLPPFAHWTPEQWRARGPECREIVERGLGWDITDFGGGDFEKLGLFLFTLRNGALEDLEARRGKVYAEKIMIVEEAQVTPTHFHFTKTEDIINRGGGELVIRLWNADENDGLADSEVVLGVDGVERRFPAGGELVLTPGESVTLPTRLYHKFWGAPGKGRVLVGEVSVVNDDNTDNRFLEPMGRFPEIEEDEPPLRLLCGEVREHCSV